MKRAYVIGSPIRHSISPAIHNAAFRALGQNARYEAVEVQPAELRSWVQDVRGPDLLGFNVTVPHKETIVPLLDEIWDDAKLAGAVNTVFALQTLAAELSLPPTSGTRVRTRRRDWPPPLIGVNTDTLGFRVSLKAEANVDLRGRRVALLGAGGAARAVAIVALQDGAASLVVANRHVERAENLLIAVDDCNDGTAWSAVSLDGPELASAMAEANVIVNATSVGLDSNEVPIDPELIPPESLVVDLVYYPRETAFLQAARTRGAAVLGGLGMLVCQAAAAFERWNHVAAPVEVMRQAAEEALEEREASSRLAKPLEQGATGS